MPPSTPTAPVTDSPYRDVDWDALERERELEEDIHGPNRVLASPKTSLVKAVGGPFDGMDLNVPPGGNQVLLPAAYGDGDMRGMVIYKRDGGVMQYLGQPEQIPDDEDGDSGTRPTLLV